MRAINAEIHSAPPISHPYSRLDASDRSKLIKDLENTRDANNIPTTKAHLSLQFDKASEQTMAALRDKFTQAIGEEISKNPRFARVVENYHTDFHPNGASEDQIYTLNRITDIQSEAYGIRIAHTRLYHDGRPGAPAGENMGGRVGANTAFKSFGAVATTVIHENQHSFQNFLASSLASMPTDHPLRSAAEIFHLNLGLGRNGSVGNNDGWAHDLEAVERDAHATQYQAKDVILSHIDQKKSDLYANRTQEIKRFDPDTTIKIRPAGVAGTQRSSSVAHSIRFTELRVHHSNKGGHQNSGVTVRGHTQPDISMSGYKPQRPFTQLGALFAGPEANSPTGAAQARSLPSAGTSLMENPTKRAQTRQRTPGMSFN